MVYSPHVKEAPRNTNENQGCRTLATWVAVGIPVQVGLTLIDYALLTQLGMQSSGGTVAISTAIATPGTKIITDSLVNRINRNRIQN